MTTKRRNKGEGSITQLSNGKYKMTITIGKGLDGKQKRKSITASTKKELFDKAAYIKAQYGVMTQAEVQAQLSTETYREFSKKMAALQEAGLTENTKNTYKNIDEKYLLPRLGDNRMKDITPHMCETLICDLLWQNKLSGATLRGIKSRMSYMFKQAVKRDILAVNPLDKTDITLPPKNKKALMTLPTVEKMQELLTYMKEKRLNLYPMVYTAIYTGMRRGELLGLKWPCVDFDKKTITINNQITDRGNSDAPLKTETSYRTIYVSDKLLEVLKDIPHKSQYVFTSPATGTHYSRGVTTNLKNIFREVDMPEHFSMHDLRHFHATQLIMHNANIKVVSRRLGHKDIKVTLDLYFNFMPSMDEEASRIMDTIID